MESIHRRIKRLRLAKGLSQTALAKAAGTKYQSVQEWERDDGTGTAPSRKRQPQVAAALGVSEPELLTGYAKPRAESGDLKPKEEILLLLFRGLFSHQQKELVAELRALFDANQYVRVEMGLKALNGVSNESVRDAFGEVPKPAKKRKIGRSSNLRGQHGDHPGDQDVE